MKIKPSTIKLMFILFIAVIFPFTHGEQSIGMSMNTCGELTVGDKMPTQPFDCLNDKSVDSKNQTCCYISASTPIGSATFCYAVSNTMTTSQINILGESYGVKSEVTCSTNKLEFEFFIIIIGVFII